MRMDRLHRQVLHLDLQDLQVHMFKVEWTKQSDDSDECASDSNECATTFAGTIYSNCCSALTVYAITIAIFGFETPHSAEQSCGPADSGPYSRGRTISTIRSTPTESRLH